jgi:hypothetical protein
MNEMRVALGLGDVRSWYWIGILGFSSIAFSLVFACATPFVALAALAAVSMDRRDAAIVTGLAWIANQLVGYGILNYPQTFNSFAWGAVIGVAAYAGLASALAIKHLLGNGLPALAVGFAAAFVGYELMLYAANPFLSDNDAAFSWSIIFYVLKVNVLALVGLYVVRALTMAAGLQLPARLDAAVHRH